MERCLTATVFCIFTATLHGDEAVLRNGRKVGGTLKHDGTRWNFQPTRGEPLDPGQFLSVSLESSAVPPLHSAVPLRLLLRDSQHLTGALDNADAKHFSLLSASAGKVLVPRTAVVGLRQPPGWALVSADTFEEPRSWKLAGRPPLHGPASSDRGLTLNEAGQIAEFVLPKPLAEGRVGLSFHDRSPESGRWFVDAEFQTGRATRLCTIQLNAEKSYRASVEGLEGKEHPAPRSAGWHRLVVQLSPRSLSAAVDGNVLWHSVKTGPGGPLVKVRIRCEGASIRGSLSFGEFSLHRPVDEPRRPPGDAEQDEAWLLDGGQLFGRILSLDRQAIALEGKFGKRSLPWTQVRGVFPLQEQVAAAPPGPVRLWLDNGFDSQPDQLDGEVRSFGPANVILRHARLGELTLKRSAVLRIVWTANDQR